MTKNKMKLTDTFTVADLNTVTASMRSELKNEIKEVQNEEIDINNIEELTDRLTKLKATCDILELFDALVDGIVKGLEKLRAEETK